MAFSFSILFLYFRYFWDHTIITQDAPRVVLHLDDDEEMGIIESSSTSPDYCLNKNGRAALGLVLVLSLIVVASDTWFRYELAVIFVLCLVIIIVFFSICKCKTDATIARQLSRRQHEIMELGNTVMEHPLLLADELGTLGTRDERTQTSQSQYQALVLSLIVVASDTWFRYELAVIFVLCLVIIIVFFSICKCNTDASIIWQLSRRRHETTELGNTVMEHPLLLADELETLGTREIMKEEERTQTSQSQYQAPLLDLTAIKNHEEKEKLIHPKTSSTVEKVAEQPADNDNTSL
eukprot:CAMPEP_0202474696 /NCGR_PEP_ID=MMETSP1360-20130828/92519_1 /ASSEMBLY_ACC=CAM_ASM_000848 /TAXON_ID=515479 /ORGANISM="Licmophora paradoxa, Strain CCMP2313" /LENGTH=293 /DNA_ID=CAMNT_0049101833 /DNA_START=1006 /DNA_END=1887 /DNA_ORIENTATION=-